MMASGPLCTSFSRLLGRGRKNTTRKIMAKLTIDGVEVETQSGIYPFSGF